MTTEELNELRRTHRVTKNKRAADRIKAVYSLAVGHNINRVLLASLCSEIKN